MRQIRKFSRLDLFLGAGQTKWRSGETFQKIKPLYAFSTTKSFSFSAKSPNKNCGPPPNFFSNFCCRQMYLYFLQYARCRWVLSLSVIYYGRVWMKFSQKWLHIMIPKLIKPLIFSQTLYINWCFLPVPFLIYIHHEQ